MVVGKITVVGPEAPPNCELFGRKLPFRFQYEYIPPEAG
jgi:hypothetical protein